MIQYSIDLIIKEEEQNYSRILKIKLGIAIVNSEK